MFDFLSEDKKKYFFDNVWLGKNYVLGTKDAKTLIHHINLLKNELKSKGFTDKEIETMISELKKSNPSIFKKFWFRIKNKYFTPTQIIERAPADRERLWFKKPGGILRRASSNRHEESNSVGSVFLKEDNILPKPNETMHIHNHPNLDRQRLVVLPSFSDIVSEINQSKYVGGPSKTSVIAIKEGDKVAGYTFFKIDKLPEGKLSPDYYIGRKIETGTNHIGRFSPSRDLNTPLKKYEKLIYDYYQKKERTDQEYFDFYNQSLALLNEIGIRIRFTPNQKEGYIFKDGQFIKNK